MDCMCACPRPGSRGVDQVLHLVLAAGGDGSVFAMCVGVFPSLGFAQSLFFDYVSTKSASMSPATKG